MKNQIICLLTLLILNAALLAQPTNKVVNSNSFNQGVEKLNKYLISLQSKTSPDQVFVHTDRNLYSPGDTVHFQAYIRNAVSGEIESASTSLYTMLFNEQHEIADSSRFKVFGATSAGWMAIPRKAKLGKYRLVAFTSMMQNEDPDNAFKIELKVDSKLVEPENATVTFNKEFYLPGDTIEATVKITTYKKHPIANKKVIVSLKNGNNLNEVDKSRINADGESVVKFILPKSGTNNYQLQVELNKNINKVYISKSFDIPFRAKYIDFSLLPEGGTLILGREQRIGFNAVNESGQSIAIIGLLKDKDGLLIDTIQSGKYGPGLFICRPQKGMYVELINEDYEKKIWPLPAFDGPDVCMSVKPSGTSSIVILVQSTKYKGDEYCIAGFMNNTLYFFQNVKLLKKESFAINTKEIPRGALQIMLFDKEMKPVAQRLVYVNDDKRLKFNITSDTSAYSPCQETELTVNVTDSLGNPQEGIFSISAVNYLNGTDPETFVPNIEYSFNYHPYFKKNLPVKVLMDGLENISDEWRDLLLMVYGWSKISWDFNRKDSIKKELVNYDLLNMKILYASKANKANRRMDLVSLQGLSVKHLFTNKNGEISLPLDSLNNETSSFFLTPGAKNKNKILGTTFSIPFNGQYFKSENLFTEMPKIPREISFSYPILYNISIADSIIKIPEVTIKQSLKRVYNDEYEERYQLHSVRSIGHEDLWKCSTMEQAIYRLNGVTFAPDHSSVIIIRHPRSLIGGVIPALIVLDGNPLYDDKAWINIQYLNPADIQSITLLKDETGYYEYGSAALGGVIFINTTVHNDNSDNLKRHDEWKAKNSKDKMFLPITLYRPHIEYYNPTKAEFAANPEFQERTTIYWNPNIYFDGKEPVKIKFPNNYKQGLVMVTINGVSGNNLVGSGKYNYMVKK